MNTWRSCEFKLTCDSKWAVALSQNPFYNACGIFCLKRSFFQKSVFFRIVQYYTTEFVCPPVESTSLQFGNNSWSDPVIGLIPFLLKMVSWRLSRRSFLTLDFCILFCFALGREIISRKLWKILFNSCHRTVIFVGNFGCDYLSGIFQIADFHLLFLYTVNQINVGNCSDIRNNWRVLVFEFN